MKENALLKKRFYILKKYRQNRIVENKGLITEKCTEINNTYCVKPCTIHKILEKCTKSNKSLTINM